MPAVPMNKETENSGSTDGLMFPLHSASVLPPPLVLSPAPTPITSPAVYTPPTPGPAAGDRVNIEKWRHIARKLSFHYELRAIWNQLKIRGGFLSNENFISHLLRHEAARQSVEYDILSVKEEEPCDVPEAVQLSDSERENGTKLTAERHVQPNNCALSSRGDIVTEDSFQPAMDTPQTASGDTNELTVADSDIDKPELKKELDNADSSTQQLALTVLESRMESTLDDQGDLTQV